MRAWDMPRRGPNAGPPEECAHGAAEAPTGVAGEPVISVDTKKNELVENFKNGGREWQPKGTPPAVLVHDFPTDAEGRRFRTASTTWRATKPG